MLFTKASWLFDMNAHATTIVTCQTDLMQVDTIKVLSAIAVTGAVLPFFFFWASETLLRQAISVSYALLLVIGPAYILGYAILHRMRDRMAARRLHGRAAAEYRDRMPTVLGPIKPMSIQPQSRTVGGPLQTPAFCRWDLDNLRPVPGSVVTVAAEPAAPQRIVESSGEPASVKVPEPAPMPAATAGPAVAAPLTPATDERVPMSRLSSRPTWRATSI